MSQTRHSLPLFVSGGAGADAADVVAWLNSSENFAIGTNRFADHFARHRAFPAGALTKERFFDADLTELQDLANRWDSAQFVGDASPLFWRRPQAIWDAFPRARLILVHQDVFQWALDAKAQNPTMPNLCSMVLAWNEWARAVLDLYDCVGVGTKQDQMLILSRGALLSGALDRRVLASFLGRGLQDLPPVPMHRLGPDEPKQTLTTNELEIIWSLVDEDAHSELRRVLHHQDVKWRAALWSSNKSKRVEWYHRKDKADAGIDYGEVQLPGCPMVFRGRTDGLPKKDYGVCIGSATTFGRFVKKPFCSQLEDLSGFPLVNLGIGGGRPESYLCDERLIDYISEAKFVLFDVMSARGYSSPIFSPRNSVDNLGYFCDSYDFARRFPGDHYLKFVESRQSAGELVFVDRVYEMASNLLDRQQKEHIRSLIFGRYCRDMLELLRRVGRPALGVMVTKNAENRLDQSTDTKTYEGWAGSYPHFVDESIVGVLARIDVPVLISRGARGLPYSVKNWITGAAAAVYPWQEDPSLNDYYPSQEMHDDAARLIWRSGFIQNQLA